MGAKCHGDSSSQGGELEATRVAGVSANKRLSYVAIKFNMV